MTRPVKTLLHGLADPSQAVEAAVLGIDGVVVALEGSGSEARELDASTASRLAGALPPLAARFAWVGDKAALPAAFPGAVTDVGVSRPEGACAHIVRLGHEQLEDAGLPPADGIWIRPRDGVRETALGFHWERVARLALHHRVLLEIPDGAEGVETAIRLGSPYAVVLARAVWYRPGIIDLDRLEAALSAVARLNKSALG